MLIGVLLAQQRAKVEFFAFVNRFVLALAEKMGTRILTKYEINCSNQLKKERKMMKITCVVVPVVFLKTTYKLIDYVITMAEKLSAVINFLYVAAFSIGDEKILAEAQTRMLNLLEWRSKGISKNSAWQCCGACLERFPLPCVNNESFQNDITPAQV